MAINFVKMFDPEAAQDTRADYKQKMALAQSLLAGDTGAIYSPAAGIAKVAEKAAGGWLARSIQDEENKAQDDAWNSVASSPLVKALIGGAGSGSGAAGASIPAGAGTQTGWGGSSLPPVSDVLNPPTDAVASSLAGGSASRAMAMPEEASGGPKPSPVPSFSFSSKAMTLPGDAGSSVPPSMALTLPGEAGGSAPPPMVFTPTNDERNRDLAIRTVIGEAANQGDIGQMAVAAVLKNRAAASGRSISDEALAKNQFEPWGTEESRNRLLSIDPNSEQYQRVGSLVDQIMSGQAQDPTGGATAFYAPRAQASLGRPAPSWDNGTGVDLGDHRFFKLPYGGVSGSTQIASGGDDIFAGITDLSKLARYSSGPLEGVKGLILHHTGGRGTPESVIDTLNQRGLGVQYVMDRDGKIYRGLPDGARGAHMRPDETGHGLSNANTIGMEMIANDNNDLTPAQIESAQRFYTAMSSKYPGLSVYGHGELNHHKQATEAMAAVEAIRAAASGKPPSGPVQVASSDPNFIPQASSQPATPAPVQVAQAGPQANPLATALQPQIPTSIPPQLQETARQLMELGKNPRNRPFVMQQLGALQQQVVEAQKTQQQRAWELQAEARKRGYQVEDRDLQWKREQPYKDSASSVAQGNLDVSRERLQHEKEKPMTLAPGTTVYDPAKNAGVFTAPNKDQTDQQTAELRKEILGLPSYKAVAGANPAFKSMVDAAKRDDKAADLNMVYALAKILDPTSVVREGEVQMANDTQGLADKLNGFIKSIQGEGRLAPEARLGLLQEARSRMEAFKGAYDTDRQFYRGIVTRRGYNEQDVIPDFGDLPTFDPAELNSIKRNPTPPAAAPAPPAPDQDGWMTIDGVKIRRKQP